MRRLYYIASDLHVCGMIAATLKEEGISDWNFHVLSRDGIGLYQHGIHAATAYQELDVVHSGERWGLIGALIGLALGGIGYWLQPLPWDVDVLTVGLVTLVGGLFGAWQGAVAGLSRQSYKIARFRDDLAARRHLVMVDVNDHNRARVRELMNVRFPSVTFRGGDTTWISPFAPGAAPSPGAAGR